MRTLIPAAWHRASLRRMLAVTLSVGLVVLLAAEVALTWRTAAEAADAAYDRSLLGAIKSIDANISTTSGGLGVELPYRMLEFFQLTAAGPVYYRVATEDGLVTIGDAGLPPPPAPLKSNEPRFEDTVFFGTPVRVGSWARLLDHPIGGQAERQRVVIQVAESLAPREQFARALVLQAVQRDVLLLAAALGLMALAIGWALRPLDRLRQDVAGRAAQDLRPITTEAIPADLRPLVEAINQHVERNRELGAAQRRFVDDASHQLRTPLATLATQLGYALRERDPAQLPPVLAALKEQLDDTIRQTNQMLALARSDSAEMKAEPLDLAALAGDVCRSAWAEAHQRGIDLGLEAPDEPVRLHAHAVLLREALANLLHNALRFAPEGSAVTVTVSGPHPGATGPTARLAVQDQGPGIPDDQLARAGERFFRARNAGTAGSGLGLAIARSIAERHGGRLEVANRRDGPGLEAVLWVPAAG